MIYHYLQAMIDNEDLCSSLKKFQSMSESIQIEIASIEKQLIDSKIPIDPAIIRNKIILKITKYYNLDKRKFLAKKELRDREYVYARQIYYKIARKIFPKLSYKKIGKLFDKNHATVFHGIKVVNNAEFRTQNLWIDYLNIWDTLKMDKLIISFMEDA